MRECTKWRKSKRRIVWSNKKQQTKTQKCVCIIYMYISSINGYKLYVLYLNATDCWNRFRMTINQTRIREHPRVHSRKGLFLLFKVPIVSIGIVTLHSVYNTGWVVSCECEWVCVCVCVSNEMKWHAINMDFFLHPCQRRKLTYFGESNIVFFIFLDGKYKKGEKRMYIFLRLSDGRTACTVRR